MSNANNPVKIGSGGVPWINPVGPVYTGNMYLNSIHQLQFGTGSPYVNGYGLNFSNKYYYTFLNYHLGKYNIKNCPELSKLFGGLMWILFSNGIGAIAKFKDRWDVYYCTVTKQDGAWNPLEVKLTLQNTVSGVNKVYFEKIINLENEEQSKSVYVIKNNLFNLPETVGYEKVLKELPYNLELVSVVLRASSKKLLVLAPQGPSEQLALDIQRIFDNSNQSVASLVYGDENVDLTKESINIGDIKAQKIEIPNNAREYADIVDWQWENLKMLNGIPTSPVSVNNKKDHAISNEFNATATWSLALEQAKSWYYLTNFIDEFNEKEGMNAILVKTGQEELQENDTENTGTENPPEIKDVENDNI